MITTSVIKELKRFLQRALWIKPSFLCQIFKVLIKFYYFRSSHQRYSLRKDVSRNSTKFKGKHLCQSLFFLIKLQSLLKKRLWHRCFPVNLWNFYEYLFYRTPLGDCFYYLTKLYHGENSSVNLHFTSPFSLLSITDFFYKEHFFQLSLSAA